MRTTVQATGSATAFTPWVPLSDYQNPLNVGIFGIPSSDFAATSYIVEITPDDPQGQRQVSITTTGTTATVTDPAHQAVTGDCVVVTGTNSTVDTAGADITVVDINTYTYTTGAAPPAKAIGEVALLRKFPNGAAVTTGRGFSLLQQPCRAVRARLAGWTVGILNLLVIQGTGR